MVWKKIIMGVAVVFCVLLVWFLESRKGQKTREVEGFLSALSQEEFEEAYLMLSDEAQAYYGTSRAFERDFRVNFPIPVEWETRVVPDNNDGDFYEGTLVDQRGQTYKWRIAPKRRLSSDDKIFIRQFHFELADN